MKFLKLLPSAIQYALEKENSKSEEQKLLEKIHSSITSCNLLIWSAGAFFTAALTNGTIGFSDMLWW